MNTRLGSIVVLTTTYPDNGKSVEIVNNTVYPENVAFSIQKKIYRNIQEEQQNIVTQEIRENDVFYLETSEGYTFEIETHYLDVVIPTYQSI